VRITTVGRGEDDPIASETTADGEDDPDGRARNRRVQLRFTPR
jgi:OOP family OmpA-OmpF porin